MPGSIEHLEADNTCYHANWSRDQCFTVAQERAGHSPLAAAYLHRIGHWDSAICPHCQGTEETVEHLVFQCLAHDQAGATHDQETPLQQTRDASRATWNGLGW